MKKIHIVFGPQGAGKTTYSKSLALERNGVHFSIDEWMWKLFGDDLPKSMNFKWIMERVNRCEKHIWSTAIKISQCNCEVVLDLGFTKRSKRVLFSELCKERNIPYEIHFVTAPHHIRRTRVLERNKLKGESFSFEVSPAMFDFMEKEFEKPTSEELIDVKVIDTNSSK